MTTKENLEKTFAGESSEVGLYFAIVKRADHEIIKKPETI